MIRNTVVLLLTLALVSGCTSEPERPSGRPGGGGFSMPVEVATSVRDTVIDAVFAIGEIEAVQSIEVRPEIDGRITDILVREGARVGKGAPLFKVDDREIRAQVRRLEAERDLAQQALIRTQNLLEQEASSTAELEQAEANARVAEAQLELQKIQLERSTVRAPFAGIVGERVVSVGDYVNPQRTLTTLQTFNPQRAVFDVPERYAQKLSSRQTVSFRVAAVEDEFTGTVDFVDPVVRLPARTITVKAIVPNPVGALIPGMFIEARLVTEIRNDAVVIPEDAILPLEGADFVWVVKADTTVTRREVDLGVRTPGFVEIRSGVDVDESVVVGGLERLSEGLPVAPIQVERRP